MAIINSVGNLLGAVNSKADSITSVAKGILCIPSILSQFPSVLGGVANTLVSTVTKQLGDIVQGIQGIVISTITNALNDITGVVSSTLNNLLQIQATILGTVKLVEETLKGFKTRIDDIIDFSSNRENCKYAAASLAKCIIGGITQDVTKSLVNSINRGTSSQTTAIENAISKLSSPQNTIVRFTQKTEMNINKAAGQINAIKLI